MKAQLLRDICLDDASAYRRLASKPKHILGVYDCLVLTSTIALLAGPDEGKAQRRFLPSFWSQ